MRKLFIFLLLIPLILFSNSAYAATGPLKASTNNRYLVDGNNNPFFMAGDAPQSLIVNASLSDVDYYFANRQSYGVNTAWVNLLCSTGTGGNANGTIQDGVAPYNGAKPFNTGTTLSNYDLATPNETYFAKVDAVLQSAQSHGIVVFLDPIETINWLTTLKSGVNSVAKARAYGQYLGTRYSSFDNIVWMSGNDYNTWPGDDAYVQAVALGIKDTDTRHIHTIELEQSGDSIPASSQDDSAWSTTISLEGSYTYNPTYAEVLRAYNRASFMPVFLVEANYEGENDGSTNSLRRQAYWTTLSGATGQIYGNGSIWPMPVGWKTEMDSLGIIQLGYWKSLFTSSNRAWYNLVPDQTHVVVTAGYGTYTDTGNVSASDYCTAARTPDGALIIAYMPTRRTITVDMSKLSGTVTARWYDPTTGTYATVSGSPFTNTGTRQFTPSGNNSAGDGDWVLVLEANAQTPSPGPGGNSSGEGGRGGGCFIAHAAYGSYSHPDVKLLQDFRDRYLLTSTGGRIFVNCYYKLSPSIASFITQSEILRTTTKMILKPVIYGIRYSYIFVLLFPAGIVAILWWKKARFLKDKKSS